VKIAGTFLKDTRDWAYLQAGIDEGIIHKEFVVYAGERNFQVRGRAITDPASLIDMRRYSINILRSENISIVLIHCFHEFATARGNSVTFF